MKDGNTNYELKDKTVIQPLFKNQSQNNSPHLLLKSLAPPKQNKENKTLQLMVIVGDVPRKESYWYRTLNSFKCGAG